MALTDDDVGRYLTATVPLSVEGRITRLWTDEKGVERVAVSRFPDAANGERVFPVAVLVGIEIDGPEAPDGRR
ncbi:MAG: hypothetical protein LC798_13110 [Chloroflexi bacterium]|nr:hypothetical protein [Chloroflexota bacterium]